jgi:hypothetical protein
MTNTTFTIVVLKDGCKKVRTLAQYVDNRLKLLTPSQKKMYELAVNQFIYM